MLDKVMKNIGAKTVVLSPAGEVLGETFGQMRLYKSNAKVVYNDRVNEAGVLNNDTYIFVGSGEGVGALICEEGMIEFGSSRFLVIKCDFSTLKGVKLVWAALKKLPKEESA